jgi:predicted DNA-binding protein (MmcQ/YjbR family)
MKQPSTATNLPLTKPAEDPRLRRLTALCLALPEAERSVHEDHADFRVERKVFAYFLNNHHGDGIVSVCCKSALGENVDRASSYPDRFYLPAYIGSKGWFGLRLDQGAVDWREVENVLELSYCLVAPKRLASLVELHGASASGPVRRRPPPAS